MSSQYLHQIEQLVGKNGSLAEKQLIARWRNELDRFLAPADRALLNQTLGLEFGIEDTLALKINLKCRQLGAATSLLALMNDSPTLQHWGQYALHRQLRFHCGIKITPQQISHELYLYPSDYDEFARLLPDNAFREAILTLKPLFIGCDDFRGLSAYFSATDRDWVETLRAELGLTEWHGSTWAWQQIRHENGRVIPGKTALEISPLDVRVLTRFISHYPFPYFRYLVPLKNQRNGNFGRDPVTGRFALYATVN